MGGGKLAYAQKAKSGGKSSAKKAGLTFPSPRVKRYMKAGRYAQRIGAQAPIFMAAVLEYVVAEVLELAGNAARSEKKGRVKPRHLQQAINDDDELQRLFGSVTIKGGGVSQGIHTALQEKKTPKGLKKKNKEKKKAEKKKAKLELLGENADEGDGPIDFGSD